MSDNGQPKTAAIVIMGAGVMGASIAFQLARRKAGRIVVIEKDHVASGGNSLSGLTLRWRLARRRWDLGIPSLSLNQRV